MIGRLIAGLGLSWLVIMGGGAIATRATPDPGLLDPGLTVACDITPRSLEQVERVVAAGTAVPEPDAAGLPRGKPAARATIAAINELEVRFVACYNAGDWPRLFGLMTDNAARMVLDDPGSSAADLFATAGTPIAAGEPGEQLMLIAIHDARSLPDGRAMAIVWWGTVDQPADVSEVNIHLYRQLDGQWLLDEEITPWRSPGVEPIC